MANQSKICLQCGATLPLDAKEGLCPNCLLRPDILETTTLAPRKEPIPVSERIRYFGDYELDQEIARGGMGVVYTARQVSLNRRVAIKMILAGHLADEVTIKRFYAEAEAVANLKHPSIVSLHEVGSHKGQHYFSMDFIDGENLAERVRGRPLAVRQAAAIVKTIAEAIHFAHQRGVLHRDLKPANVLIDKEGHPHVTDFGLAKLIDRDSTLTQSGDFMGTPNYTSPEQAVGRSDQIGPHSDVYSLGAILYELLTGYPPFQSSNSMQTLIQVMDVDPVPPKRRNPNVPADLDTICLRCLEKLSHHRYHSAGELAQELGRFLDHEPIHARPAGFVRKVTGWVRRRPAQMAAAVAIAFAGLVGGVYYLIQENAFLHALQITPGLLREPGVRVEALEMWRAVTSVVFLVVLLFAMWVNRRMRGRLRRSADDGQFVQPFRPLGSRVETLTIALGILASLLSIAYVMNLIEAFVWEHGGRFDDITMSFFVGWVGVWLLAIAMSDYRRSLFGGPQRTLAAALNEDIDRALLERDVREAIRLYQHAFSDAGRAEAQAFVLQRFDDIRTQKPKEFAAAAPRLWDLNYRNMGVCALIEVPIVVAFWLFMQPASSIGIAAGWVIGAAMALSIFMTIHLVRFGKRILAMLPPVAALIGIGAVTYTSGLGLGLGIARSMFLGTCCGAAMMSFGFVRKHRHHRRTT
jgi:tRNA A-37 threonylcarbamoyl transferase component Bud32